MKKTVSTMLCLLLTFILCICASLTAFASDNSSDESLSLDSLLGLFSSLASTEQTDTASQSEDDLSLDDLLGLFSSSEDAGQTETAENSEDASLEDLLSLFAALGNSDTEESADNETAFTQYTLKDVTFAVPASWESDEYEDEDGNYLSVMFYSPDFMSYSSASYYFNEEGTDIYDENIADMLKEGTESDDTEVRTDYVTVCGHDSLWAEINVSESDITAASYMIAVPLDDSIFSVTYTNLLNDNADIFAQIVESVKIEGSEGETDISGVYDHSIPAVSFNTGDAGSSAAPENPGQVKGTGTEEIILLDTEDCFVSIKDITTEVDYYAMSAVVYMKNNTDKNLYISFDDVSVNDYMCSPYFGSNLDAGTDKSQDLIFYKDSFEENGIVNVHDIEFTLSVTDNDDWFADPIAKVPVKLYPFGEDAPMQDPQEFDDDTLVLLDSEDYIMYITGFENDSFFFKAHVYLENKTDKAVEFNVSGSTAVNGTEINPYFYKTLPAGKKCNSSISWLTNDLNENGIESPETLLLDISIEDPDDWFADPVYEDNISVDVKM